MKRAASRRLCSFVTLVLSVGTLSACGKSLSKQKFDSKLKFGRHAAAALPTADFARGLSLTGITGTDTETIAASIVEAKTHPLGREVLWIDFDPHSQTPLQEQDLVGHARRLPELLNEFLHIMPEDLGAVPKEVTLSSSLKSISFERHAMGIYPVRDAYFEAIYWKGDNGLYTLRQINNNTHGSISIQGKTAPAVDFETLREGLSLEQAVPISRRQVVYPEPTEPGVYRFHMATEFKVTTSDMDQVYTVTAENGTSRILEAYSSKLHAAKPLLAEVFHRHYKESTLTTKPLPEVEITVGNQKTITDIDSITDLGSASSARVLLLGSRFTVVDNTATTPISVSVPLRLSESKDAYIIEADGESRAALNAYSALVEVNRYALQFLPKSRTPFLTYNLPVYLNVPSEACNAFFASSVEIPFGMMALGEENEQCSNMAQVNDVSYHEWGHGLDNAVGVGVTPGDGITDGAFSEGIGDIVATYMTGVPEVAVGFFLANDKPLRTVENNARYPNLRNEVHVDGLIISGTFWDLRKNLIATHGPVKGAHFAANLFFNHLFNTNSYLQSYQNVLLLDDNDGNPATRSPNFCAINAAFARHGLAAAASSCTDKPDPAFIDDSIVIATKSEEENGVTLMASTVLEGVASMIACVGTRTQCDRDNARPRAQLKANGFLDSRSVFNAETPVPIQAYDTVTLYALDGDGKALGSRMFKFVSK